MAARTARQIFKENLDRLMDAQKLGQNEIHRISKARKKKVSQATLGRTIRGESAPTLTTLDAIADAFGLVPWQMLVPDIDPSAPPTLTHASIEERALYERLRTAATDIAKLK